MIEIAERLKVLGDQTRLRIFRLLTEESLNVGELTSILGLAQPTISKHLRELKNSNLPDEIRIGSIIRGNEIILPSSNYVFKKKDTVILLSKRDQLSLVESMFRISSIQS